MESAAFARRTPISDIRLVTVQASWRISFARPVARSHPQNEANDQKRTSAGKVTFDDRAATSIVSCQASIERGVRAPNSSNPLHLVISAEDKADRLEACTALLPPEVAELDAQQGVVVAAAAAKLVAQQEEVVAAAEPAAQQEVAAAAAEPVAQQEAGVAAAEPAAQQEAGVAAAEPVAHQEAGVAAAAEPAAHQEAGVAAAEPAAQQEAGMAAAAEPVAQQEVAAGAAEPVAQQEGAAAAPGSRQAVAVTPARSAVRSREPSVD